MQRQGPRITQQIGLKSSVPTEVLQRIVTESRCAIEEMVSSHVQRWMEQNAFVLMIINFAVGHAKKVQGRKLKKSRTKMPLSETETEP